MIEQQQQQQQQQEQEQQQLELKEESSDEVAVQKTEEDEPRYPDITTFDELLNHNLNPSILRGIFAKGFEAPSHIQRQAILPIMQGRDVIAQAQSGTGKTATFSIAALSRVDVTSNTCQVLILSPTRELTTQTFEVIKEIGYLVKSLRIKLLVGGNSVIEDIDELRSSQPHIIIGCPGRVFDMMKRRVLDASKIKLFILDEADEMLKSGFQDQICEIFEYLNEKVQVVLFSATLPEYTLNLTNRFMINPYKILVATENLSLEGIKQYFIGVHTDEMKIDMIKRVYHKKDIKQSIIYANSVDRVKLLTHHLERDNFSVACMHREMDKRQREEVLKAFKVGTFRILVSTDLTSRGIDVQQVSVVINFDIPRCKQVYLHRIGRSGRWGRIGTAINLVIERDIPYMRDIEEFYKHSIDEYTDL